MALAANREVDRFVDEQLRAYPLKAGVHLFKGAFVGRDSVSGYSRPLVAGDAFEGIAYEEVDNTDGANGDKSARVDTQGDFELPLSGAAVTDRGATGYASDDETLTLTASGNSAVGRLLQLGTSGNVVVRLSPS